MPTMIIMVLDDAEKLHDVTEAWRAAGAGGITMLESSGVARLLKAGQRDDFPLFPSIRDLLRNDEVHHQTLFTVLPDGADVEAFFDATETAIGRFDDPHTGIILALPVLASRGIVNRDYEG